MDTTKLLADYSAREEAEHLISRKVEQILQRMDVWGVNPEQLIRYPEYVLSEVFDLTDVDYYTGIKVFGAVPLHSLATGSVPVSGILHRIVSIDGL